MFNGHSKNQLLMIAAIASSIAGSTMAFSYASDLDNSDVNDAYLEPCVSCTPTNEDFENLTTFELLAIYPELSGDPVGNDTNTSANSTDIETPSPISNSTMTNQTLGASSSGNLDD